MGSNPISHERVEYLERRVANLLNRVENLENEVGADNDEWIDEDYDAEDD